MTRIGNIKIENPFIAAPMAGVTDSAYRGILSGMGAAITATEMVSAKGLLYGNKKTGDLLRISDEEGLVSFQLFGSEPEVMREAAKRLAKCKNSMVDINMGCPVPKVVKNREGSALMKTPELAGRVVEAVIEGTEGKKPVTVKMRAGWDENSKNAVQVAKICEKAGASAVCVHGRTRQQFYEGKADRSVIADVKQAVSVPVAGNGDIFTPQDARSMMEETGCDMVVIARGMLGNPWIFRQCVAYWNEGAWDGDMQRKEEMKEPGKEEKAETMLRHLDRLIMLKGEKVAVREMRKHFGWYTKGVPKAAEKRRAVNRIDKADELRDMIRSI